MVVKRLARFLGFHQSDSRLAPGYLYRAGPLAILGVAPAAGKSSHSFRVLPGQLFINPGLDAHRLAC